MSNVPTHHTEKALNNAHFPYFGYSLIRDVLVPDILGNESDQILYWAGKGLARKFPVKSIAEVISFFEQAGWGLLSVETEKRREIGFVISGQYVQQRLQDYTRASFHLEAGFIAEQIQLQKHCTAESYLEVKNKQAKVLITVKWDLKDPIDE